MPFCLTVVHTTVLHTTVVYFTKVLNNDPKKNSFTLGY